MLPTPPVDRITDAPLAFAATVSFRPESDETVGEGGSRTLVGTVAQQWMQTPAGLTQLAEVFGLEDWEVEKCVACMEEPKDTICLIAICACATNALSCSRLWTAAQCVVRCSPHTCVSTQLPRRRQRQPACRARPIAHSAYHCRFAVAKVKRLKRKL